LSRERLTDRVEAGEFLDSLYYRLNAIPLRVPSLRERPEDLCLLVVEILNELTPPNSTPPGVSADVWKALSSHEFPGNVRELRWILERALHQSDGKEIGLRHLPAEMHIG
jgi:DNA-binding NtrC family response regulator